ncbi:hypothetical protein MJK72_09750 [Klebsiella pneumoniae]|nr:hypothetical protein MJK72_09750 [Klebsiella pneumoniae]
MVNYELPNVPEDYVHRGCIVLVARGGHRRNFIAGVRGCEHKLLRDIERPLKKEIPRIAIAGYEPDPSTKAEPISERSPAARRRSWARSGTRRPGSGTQRTAAQPE